MKKTLSEIADILYRKNVNYNTHFTDPDKPNPNGEEKPPKFKIIEPKSNNAKVNKSNQEKVLSPIYTYMLYLENKSYRKGYTLIPIGTTNKIMLAIFGNSMKVSRSIEKMVEMNILAYENESYSFNKGKYSHCKTYKFYWENGAKLIKFCKLNNIKPKEINDAELSEEYEEEYAEEFDEDYENDYEEDNDGQAAEHVGQEDSFDAEAYAIKYERRKDVRFTSGVRFNKPNELTRAQFEKVLLKCLDMNLPYLDEYRRICNEINEKYYKDNDDLKIRLRVKFKWTKNDTITKIKLRGCCALNNYKKCDRPAILNKYGFDKEYDITSSVPRVTYLLNKKEFVAHVEKSDFALLLIYQNNETLELRIKNMMNILREHHGGQHLTFSAGICPVQHYSDDIAGILTYAGLALPRSMKIQDEIVWFNDSMKEEQVWERRIEDDMEKALENHEFQVYLQPKYSTKKEELSAAEALVRWTHPVLGFISPGKFIPIFERNGFILQLDDYMLTEVAKLQAAWMADGKKLVPISVNVSRAHFAEENLAEHICSVVDKFKVPHEYIELELTESAFFDDKAVLLTTVRKLKDFGFKVSMDDFGAGYSSLNSLKELPLDIIKLDAEFFRSVDDVERSNLIVGQTISLAKKLGMEIVAEGIETRDQVDFLAKQDCDLIQGFYFSKPLPVQEFEERAYPKK